MQVRGCGVVVMHGLLNYGRVEHIVLDLDLGTQKVKGPLPPVPSPCWGRGSLSCLAPGVGGGRGGGCFVWCFVGWWALWSPAFLHIFLYLVDRVFCVDSVVY